MLTRFPENLIVPANKPPLLKPWLDHTESLTDKLRHEAGDATLSVINQDYISPGWWDRFVLQINTPSLVQREIVISSRKNTCWYARTIIPDDTFEANELLFGRLKQESLGALIFGDTGITRHSMVTYFIDSKCIEYYWLSSAMRGNSQSFWARLSMFEINKASPFFLIEILLPGLLTALGNESN